MNEVRFLENKFAEEIQKHIIKALPNLSNSFMQFRESTDFEDCKLSFDLVFSLGFEIFSLLEIQAENLRQIGILSLLRLCSCWFH